MTKKRTQSNEFGLLQPQAVELEEAILGACMLESDAITKVADILTPECFYVESNKILFTVIIDLYKQSSPIDILTVCQKLKSLGKLEDVGGSYFVSSLTNRIASSSNIEYHSRIIVQQYLKREMIRLSTENIRNAYDDSEDVFDTFQKGITKIESAISGVIKYDVKQIGKVHEKVIAESILVAQSGIKSGVPTGFRNVDNFTNGWQKTDLIIVAGRPAMGKSVCALAFVLNPALRENIPTAIFSLEMSNDQLVGRAQSSLSGINSSRIIKKQLSVDEVRLVESRCHELDTAPIYIDDTPSLSLIDLKGKGRKLVRDKGVKLIVIDYLQLMTVDAGKGNREQEVSMISKGLKALAKELDIPIIALSQLSRAVESRGGDKKPMLSDLRESGSIEQDADMVIFTYRPEYYGIETYEINGETVDCSGLMSLIVAKHRAGSLGELRLGFNGELTKIENYDSFISNRNDGGFNRVQPPESGTIIKSIKENVDFLNESTVKQTEVASGSEDDDDDLPF
jgi:replicative DNA helicase